MRAGHTEAGCDLALMAGLTPAAVICEIMKDDGTMARLPDLERFAAEHGLKIGTIADLIEYRSRNESLISQVARRTLVTPAGPFECHAFHDRFGGVHLALTLGEWAPGDEVLVRVHEPLSVLDLLDAGHCEHSWQLLQALTALRVAERGVAVLLNCGEAGEGLLEALTRTEDEPDVPLPRSQMDLRTYGVGAQILRELGVVRMKLLGSPRRMPSMVGYGLEITGFVSAA